jgi:RimJ/RimL family protein N-acetyltransferase
MKLRASALLRWTPVAARKAAHQMASGALCFETSRLKIRPLREGERDLCCQLFTDAETMKFLGGPLSTKAADSRFESMLRANARQPVRNLYMSVDNKADCTPLGLCSAVRIDPRIGRAELGLMMAASERSKGVGREAFCGLIATVLYEFSLKELLVHYHAENAAAKRVLTLSGFSFGAESDDCGEVKDSPLKLAVLNSERWRRG